MTKETRITLYPHQSRFMMSDAYLTAIIGGIGSGKSWIGVHYVIDRLVNNPETIGFIGANTVQQLWDASLSTLKAEFERLGITYDHNKSTGWITVTGITYINENGERVPAMIKTASLENFDSLRGPEYGWIWLDETRDTKEGAYKVIVGRLRCKKSHKLEIRITTSPSGYNWLYDTLVGKKKIKNCEVIHASTYMNKSLPQDYIDSLEAQYDSKFREQELQGKFVNLSAGKLYHAFDRDIHVVKKKVRKHIPKIGTDFNVGKTCGIVAEVTDNTIHVYCEHTDHHNTFSLASCLYKYYKGHGDIVPDSTGKSKKTSSKKTDHQILKDKNFNVVRTKNPFKEDRWNTVNRLLEECRLTFDPSVIELIEEMERADASKGDREGDHYHITVALGYICYKYFPLKIKRNRKSRVIII